MTLVSKKDQDHAVTVVISVDPKDWQAAQEAEMNQLVKGVKVPGFRPGKTPANIAKEHINPNDLYMGASNRAVRASIWQFLASKDGANLFETPKDLKIIDSKGKGLQFEVTFDKFPIVETPKLSEIKIQINPTTATPDEIKQHMNYLIGNDRLLIPKKTDVAEKGDVVNIDFKGFLNDQPFAGGEAAGYDLELGSNSFIPGFEEQLIGSKRGDKKTINVTFPKDYHVSNLAAQQVKFEVVIHDIKTIQEPEMNKQYFQKLNLPPHVETIEDFKKHCATLIENYKKGTQRREIVSKVIDYLSSHSKLSYFPDGILQDEKNRIRNELEQKAAQQKISVLEYVQQNNNIQNEKGLSVYIEQQAKNSLVVFFAIHKINQDNNLLPTEAECDKFLEEESKKFKITIDELKKQFNNDYKNIMNYIAEKKLIDAIVAQSK